MQPFLESGMLPSQGNNTQEPDVLTAIATICLGGALADGEAVPVEIEACSKKMQQELFMSKGQSFRIIWNALCRLSEHTKGDALEGAFSTLNAYLTPSQRENLYWGIEDIVSADKKFDMNEILYLVLASNKLGISRI